jgi:hypothetical protein
VCTSYPPCLKSIKMVFIRFVNHIKLNKLSNEQRNGQQQKINRGETNPLFKLCTKCEEILERYSLGFKNHLKIKHMQFCWKNPKTECWAQFTTRAVTRKNHPMCRCSIFMVIHDKTVLSRLYRALFAPMPCVYTKIEAQF